MSELKKWEVLEETDVSPSPYYKVFKHTVKLPNGKIIDDFYVSRLGDVSTVIAVTDDKKIICVRQYKHGIQDFTIELPAGRIKKDKTPLEGAQMEFVEETGYTASKYTEIGYVCPVPSKDSVKVYGFIATGLVDTKQKHFDETEEIELLYLTFAEIEEYIKAGKMIGSDAIGLLYLAKLKFPELLS